jgi:hypothetical protein
MAISKKNNWPGFLSFFLRPEISTGRKRLKRLNIVQFGVFLLFLQNNFAHFFSARGAPHGAPPFPAPQLTLFLPSLRLEPEKKNQA